MSNNMRQAVVRAGVLTAMVGSVFGFIGDVLQPLLDLAPIVLGLSLVGTLVALIWIVRIRRQQGHLEWDSPAGGLFIFCLASTGVFAVLSVVFAVGPERGYLASSNDGIAQFQAALLNLQQDVSVVKQTTQVTQQDVVAVATAQARGFDEVQRSFAALQVGQGNLVGQPGTPTEWYSNARLYQLRGDTANALAAYEGYFKFKLDYLDPYAEYVALLTSTSGIARARDAIEMLRGAQPDSLPIQLSAIRLIDAAPDRLARLIELTTRAPQFAPAFKDLGDEYARSISGGPTADRLQKLAAAYETLFQLEKSQAFSRYFIDKATADQQLQEAHATHDSLAAAAQVMSHVEFNLYPYYNGVQIVVVLPEVGNARQLLIGFDAVEPLTDTGRIGTGAQTFVNTSVGPVPLPVGDHTVYARYIDANGVASPVYSQTFRIDPIAITVQQPPADFTTGKRSALFTAGVLNGNVTDLWTYKYSVDSSALDHSTSGSVMTSITINDLTPGAHSLHIQATRDQATGPAATTPLVEYPFTIN
jgi:tetratricopeptide (TPR) repeat protein